MWQTNCICLEDYFIVLFRTYTSGWQSMKMINTIIDLRSLHQTIAFNWYNWYVIEVIALANKIAALWSSMILRLSL